MWQLLSRKIQLTVLFVAGFLVSKGHDAVAALMKVEQPTLWQSVSLTVLLVGTVLSIIAELLWRWIWRRSNWLQTKTFPYLEGKWTGELVSTWIDPETGERKPPIPTTITIKQGLFVTSVCLETGESSSNSKHVYLEKLRQLGIFRVWYDYHNGPKAAVRHRSQPHDGFAFLEMKDSDLNRLVGQYFTARKTTGDINVTRQPEGAQN
jgi:hypothetical protein